MSDVEELSFQEFEKAQRQKLNLKYRQQRKRQRRRVIEIESSDEDDVVILSPSELPPPPKATICAKVVVIDDDDEAVSNPEPLDSPSKPLEPANEKEKTSKQPESATEGEKAPQHPPEPAVEEKNAPQPPPEPAAEEKNAPQPPPEPAAEEKNAPQPPPEPAAEEKNAPQPPPEPAAEERNTPQPPPEPAAEERNTPQPPPEPGAEEKNTPVQMSPQASPLKPTTKQAEKKLAPYLSTLKKAVVAPYQPTIAVIEPIMTADEELVVTSIVKPEIKPSPTHENSTQEIVIHNAPGPSSSNDKRYSCEACNETFCFKSAWNFHLTSLSHRHNVKHNGPRPTMIVANSFNRQPVIPPVPSSIPVAIVPAVVPPMVLPSQPVPAPAPPSVVPGTIVVAPTATQKPMCVTPGALSRVPQQLSVAPEPIVVVPDSVSVAPEPIPAAPQPESIVPEPEVISMAPEVISLAAGLASVDPEAPNEPVAQVTSEDDIASPIVLFSNSELPPDESTCSSVKSSTSTKTSASRYDSTLSDAISISDDEIYVPKKKKRRKRKQLEMLTEDADPSSPVSDSRPKRKCAEDAQNRMKDMMFLSTLNKKQLEDYKNLMERVRRGEDPCISSETNSGATNEASSDNTL